MRLHQIKIIITALFSLLDRQLPLLYGSGHDHAEEVDNFFACDYDDLFVPRRRGAFLTHGFSAKCL